MKAIDSVKNALRPLIMEVSYKPALLELGYEPIGSFPVSSNIVYRCKGSPEDVIAKMARMRTTSTYQELRQEANFLRIMDGHETIPHFIDYHTHISGSNVSALTNLLRLRRLERDIYDVLVRSYIPGREFEVSDKITDTQQQSRLHNAIATFHTEGFVLFGIDNPRNMILGEDSNVYFIDFGRIRTKRKLSQRDFDELVIRSFDELERWFD